MDKHTDMEKFTNGFIQLVKKENGDVLAQRKGAQHQLNYFAKCTWNVTDDLELRFVEKTELAHPIKFFKALHKETIVSVFANDLGNKMPTKIPAAWTGTVADFELLDNLWWVWDAYTQDGEWVGTSEF